MLAPGRQKMESRKIDSFGQFDRLAEKKIAN